MIEEDRPEDLAEAQVPGGESFTEVDLPPFVKGGFQEPSLRMPGRQGAGAGNNGEAVAALEARVAELEVALQDKERQLQRLAADFENSRRRAATEKDELARFAASRVLENFLPIVDNFERAVAHSSVADAAGLLRGIEMILRQMVDFLGKQGVAAMEPVGQEFDPNLHEAIGQIETTEQADNTVMTQVQKGYFYNGRVLRPAMVQVANNPAGVAAVNAVHDAETSDEDLMAGAQAFDGSKEESHG